MMRVLVGMSGGVDSSACAVVLMKQGYDVTGCTVKMFGDSEVNIRDAKAVCDKLGIEHIVLDFSDVFREKVIGSFLKTYLLGNTPNPCIQCNKYLKFGKMLEKAEEMGFDFIATGHYAGIEKDADGKYVLKRAEDSSKDQTYVLYNLTQYQLSHTLFTLAGYSKPEIRSIASEAGLINAEKPDSQDICFIPDGDYAKFIRDNTDTVIKRGKYIDTEGTILGEHSGVIHYTIGQRKGLGVTFGKPMFVVGKNASDNTVTLGESEKLFSSKLTAGDVNFISGEYPARPINVYAKVRYSQKEQPATVVMKDGIAIVEFDEPQRAVAPGQSVVFYDGDICLGGGIIIKGE